MIPAPFTYHYILYGSGQEAHCSTTYAVNRWTYKDKKRRAPKAEGEAIRFDIEPLIDRATWERLQKKIQSNKVRSKNVGLQREEFWLRDVLRCDECGGKVKPHKGSIRKSNGRAPRYYSCYWTSCTEKTLTIAKHERCHLPLIKAEELEGVVWGKVLHLLLFWRNKDRLRALLSPARWKREEEAAARELKKVKSQIARKERARGNLLAILEGRSLGPEEQDRFMRDLGAVDSELRRLKDLSLLWKETGLNFSKRVKDSSSWIKFASDRKLELESIATKLIELSPPMKRELINAMCDSPILVAGDRRDDRDAWICSNYPSRIDLDVLDKILSGRSARGGSSGGSDNTGGGGPNCSKPSWAFNNSNKDRRRLFLAETYSIVFQRPC